MILCASQRASPEAVFLHCSYIQVLALTSFSDRLEHISWNKLFSLQCWFHQSILSKQWGKQMRTAMNNIFINIITIIESLKGTTWKSNVPKGNVQSYWWKSRSQQTAWCVVWKEIPYLAKSIGATDRKSSWALENSSEAEVSKFCTLDSSKKRLI